MLPPSEDAMRARVIAHMNKDDRGKLSLYLRAFAGLSSSSSSNPQLEELSLDSMAIRTTDHNLHHIPITPPMSSLSEARQTMVRLDREARSKLDLGDVTVTDFRPAKGMDAVVGGAVAFYYFSFFSLAKVLEGAGMWGELRKFWDAVFPGGIGGYEWVVRTIFWMVVAIHVTECFFLDRTRLRRFGVRRGSWVWCMWIGTCFFEGWPSFRRFDRLVGEVRVSKGKEE